MKRLLAIFRPKKNKKESNPQNSKIPAAGQSPIKIELYRDDSDLGYC